MNTIMIILNGIHLPYHVIHYAITKAKENTANISALFLSGKSDHSRGYFFPSDLTSVESLSSDKDVEGEDNRIIQDNMLLIKQMIELEDISYTSSVKTNISIDEIVESTASADLVILDEDFDNYPIMGDNKISLKKLKQKIIKPVDVVPNK